MPFFREATFVSVPPKICPSLLCPAYIAGSFSREKTFLVGRCGMSTRASEKSVWNDSTISALEVTVVEE